MKIINTELLNKEIQQFIDERNWEQFHSIKNLSMALSVEVSELVEIFQWLKEEESNNVAGDKKIKLRMEEEIADIFIYLLRISFKANIDIEKAVLEKIKKNAQKYPIGK